MDGPGAITPELARDLERVRASFGPESLSSDPLRYVRRFESREDREVAGFLAAALAFGKVAAIFRSLDDLFARLGPSPARTSQKADVRDLGRRLRGFRHRWIGARDLAPVVSALGGLLREHGSLERLFIPASSEECDLRLIATRFAEEVRLRAFQSPARGISFLVPSPRTGSACKRLNLFLRWMVRPDDGLDLGLWTALKPSHLVIPLDTHMAFLGRALGLTRRRTPDWAMAVEITRALRTLDPDDPVKYDWAMTRLGILGYCPERRHQTLCPPCPLFLHCVLGRRAGSLGRRALHRRREWESCPPAASR